MKKIKDCPITEKLLSKLGFEKEKAHWYKSGVPYIGQWGNDFFIPTDSIEGYQQLRLHKTDTERYIRTQKELYDIYKELHVEDKINWIYE